MELGNPIPAGQSLSPGEQLIENLWYVNFDFDGDPNTGINESFGNEQGVDAGLWLANYTDTQLKIELETFRDWGMKEYLVVDEGGESYIHTRPMQDYRFDATENKLIIRDKIAEINYKTRIRVGFEGGNPNIQSFIDMELATIQENANLFGEINEEIGEQVCADSAMFISETIPDNTIFKPLQPFTKTWTVRNSGTCVWTTQYHLAHSGNDRMNGPAYTYLNREVKPGESYQFQIDLTAPEIPNSYKGYWDLRNDHGQAIGVFFVIIKVQ